jgi:glycosyltransferase involved in cell wall biosynthesis
MRISYIAICYSVPESGIGKKIQDQINYWRDSGHVVSLYLLTNRANNDEWIAKGLAKKIWIDDRFLTKMTNRKNAMKLAQKNFSQVVYFRDAFPIPMGSHKIKKVLEVNSIQKNEVSSQSFVKKLAYKLFAKRFYGQWDGVVYVTREIEDSLEREVPALINRPSAVISNGIDFRRIPSLPVSLENNLNFVFLGEPGLLWNGIDSIIDLARVLPNCTFHIIGENQKSKSEINNNVRFYGFMHQDEYQQILMKCHVAIGTMGAERKQIKQGCSLKTREYLASGLPIVIRYWDSDFHEGTTDFILNIPLDEKPLSNYANQILAFGEKWKHSRVPISNVSAISIESKENQRLEFFESILF